MLFEKTEFVMVTLAPPVPVGAIWIPAPVVPVPLPLMFELMTWTLATSELLMTMMPLPFGAPPLKSRITQSSTISDAP